MPPNIYGNLIRFDTGNGSGEEVLERVPLYASVFQGGVSEDTLQDLLFRSPRALPISAIDATYGDGIQDGAANIVDFVQCYSGLHFNLAPVEAALYRDGANRLIVQPRVLVQTEIVQRFVIDGSVERVAVVDDADTQQETLSDQDEENLRFWTAVLRGYDFADATAEIPPPVKDSTLYVTMRHSGFSG